MSASSKGEYSRALTITSWSSRGRPLPLHDRARSISAAPCSTTYSSIINVVDFDFVGMTKSGRSCRETYGSTTYQAHGAHGQERSMIAGPEPTIISPRRKVRQSAMQRYDGADKWTPFHMRPCP